jgi:putative transposase
MRYRRVKVPGGTYFFTLVTEGRRTIFNDPLAVALFEAGLNRVKERHPFIIDAYVVLPDHIHTLWTLPENDDDFSMRWRLIKEAFTKSFVRHRTPLARSTSRIAKGEQPIWQRRFWEHTIRDEDDYAAHVDYIHYNPVQHGLVVAARDWPHSSFAAWVERGLYEPHWGSGDMLTMPKSALRSE